MRKYVNKEDCQHEIKEIACLKRVLKENSRTDRRGIINNLENNIEKRLIELLEYTVQFVPEDNEEVKKRLKDHDDYINGLYQGDDLVVKVSLEDFNP